MDFILFLLVAVILFLRPQDFVPDAATLPVYLVALLLAALVACGPVAAQLGWRRLTERPITVCVLGLLPAIVLSHLTHGLLWEARTGGTEFLKVLLFYLVLVGVATTTERLRLILTWLAGLFVVVTVLALLQYHGVLTLPQATVFEQRAADEETGTEAVVRRLCGLGLYNDPNDLCLLLVVGIGIAAYRLGGADGTWQRLPWLAALGVLGYGLALTQSRGGFLALLVGLLVWLHARFGRWKALALGGALVPVLFVALAGRQTELATSGDTGQDRIQLWSEALELFKQEPVFGIGQGAFADAVGLVAHNSFIHCFAEFGLFGGALFLGAFVAGLWGLVRLARADLAPADPELRRLRPYLLAILAAYAMGILSLSRAYVPGTYLVLGLATAYLALAAPGQALALPRFDFRFMRRLAFASAAFLAAMHLFVKVAINRG